MSFQETLVTVLLQVSPDVKASSYNDVAEFLQLADSPGTWHIGRTLEVYLSDETLNAVDLVSTPGEGQNLTQMENV